MYCLGIVLQFSPAPYPLAQSLSMEIFQMVPAPSMKLRLPYRNAAWTPPRYASVYMLRKANASDIPATFQNIYEPALKFSTVRYCDRLLTGYWMGPDIEDGWGFVEAFIFEIQ